MKHLVKQTIDQIESLKFHPAGYGFQVSAMQLQMAGFSPGGFARELFQHTDVPIVITEPPKTGSLIISLDADYMAREAVKQ